eukprot:TRINITY_DN41536_c0_g1_i1.p2 TRINITY_DN41536_c0_g1~~TRINITY_DN41536_c0_g1_i1.p2  ORF type:complete len:315 (+),score=165.03 TRINITY_DN41536_c0_g1_i1:1535-2479(+)
MDDFDMDFDMDNMDFDNLDLGGDEEQPFFEEEEDLALKVEEPVAAVAAEPVVVEDVVEEVRVVGIRAFQKKLLWRYKNKAYKNKVLAEEAKEGGKLRPKVEQKVRKQEAEAFSAFMKEVYEQEQQEEADDDLPAAVRARQKQQQSELDLMCDQMDIEDVPTTAPLKVEDNPENNLDNSGDSTGITTKVKVEDLKLTAEAALKMVNLRKKDDRDLFVTELGEALNNVKAVKRSEVVTLFKELINKVSDAMAPEDLTDVVSHLNVKKQNKIKAMKGKKKAKKFVGRQGFANVNRGAFDDLMDDGGFGGDGDFDDFM